MAGNVVDSLTDASVSTTRRTRVAEACTQRARRVRDAPALPASGPGLNYDRGVEPYNIWKFLHIASMIGAVSILVGQGMLTGVVARSGDVRALRRVLAAGDRFGPFGGGCFY
jgi:hypothetical protein